MVGYLGHRRRVCQRPSSPGPDTVLSYTLAAVGIGAVVRIGYGRGIVGIRLLLHVSVNSSFSFELEASSWKLGAYAESHSVDHSFHAAGRRDPAVVYAGGEQECHSLGGEH